MIKGDGRDHRHGAKEKCRKTLVHLSEYVDGDIRPPDKKSLEEHLSGCKACVAVLATLKKTIQLFRAAKPKGPSKAMRLEIMRNIRGGKDR